MTSHELDKNIKEYLAGNNDAFDLIYYETNTSVFLSIRVIIKNQTIIEDLMQDTYMKAIDNLKSYKLGTNFKAWISRIARNIAINYYNHEKKLEIHEIDDKVFSDKEDSNSKLNYYLNFLEGTEREVVIYHLILQMKFKEIASIINQPLSTVFLIYKKAIEKIKSKVD